MKNRTLFFALCAMGLAAATPLLSGCGLLGSRATQAYSDYQAALAAGDMTRAQIALLTLVNAKEDVPDYWIELGKIDLQLGQYAQAYDAFSRAHELDRTNVEVQAALTQLALLSGQIDLADEQAKTLALLAPDHPAVALVRGYVALKSGDLLNYRVSSPTIMKHLRNNSIFAFGQADRARSSASFREILAAMWLFNRKFEKAMAKHAEIGGQ